MGGGGGSLSGALLKSAPLPPPGYVCCGGDYLFSDAESKLTREVGKAGRLPTLPAKQPHRRAGWGRRDAALAPRASSLLSPSPVFPSVPVYFRFLVLRPRVTPA